MAQAAPGRMLLRSTLWHAVAVAVFIHGFLLTRIELPHVSSCGDLPAAAGGCWSSAAFDRTVIVIVDALRYDFMVNDVYNSSYAYAGLMPKTLATAQQAVRAHGRICRRAAAARRRYGLLGRHCTVALLRGCLAGRRRGRAALRRGHADHHYEQAEGAAHGGRLR